jgi:hypothetical protein
MAAPYAEDSGVDDQVARAEARQASMSDDAGTDLRTSRAMLKGQPALAIGER